MIVWGGSPTRNRTSTPEAGTTPRPIRGPQHPGRDDGAEPPDRGVDGVGDDRVGRKAGGGDQYGRPLRSSVEPLEDDHDDRCSGRTGAPRRRLDRYAHGRLGGRYRRRRALHDPFTDTWTPVATTGAPAVRVDASAVWTGTEIIVWGGGGLAETNAGGRYNPATDTWLPTSTGTNVPTPRWKHTAIWTGSRMVVWGGWSIRVPQSTGGRYDPVTDTWQATTTAGAPSARIGHAAAWTGDRMVILGGSVSSGAVVNDGGRYYPVGDFWTPTSVTGQVPSTRETFAAVRAGNEILVWGGTPVTASGARYCLGPCTPTTWYQDSDGDGYGNDAVTTTACDEPVGYSPYRGDCDDGSPGVRPNATEACNGIDDDCDTSIEAVRPRP